MDNGGNFNIYEGTFSVPIDGTYWFLINGLINGGIYGDIEMRVNGEVKHYFVDYEDSGLARSPTFFVSLQLKINDEVKLSNYYSNTFISNEIVHFTFMGYQIY